ncbi:hypothetical protein UlMin_043408 [Ulmus minor]
MDPNRISDEVAFEFPYVFRLYKAGHIDRIGGEDFIPPSANPENRVRSKDTVISPKTGLSARLFLPKIPDPTRKLPLLVYFHGGAFCGGSPFCFFYHNYTSLLASEANVVVLSIHYRRPPEHLLPIAYDDAWEAIRWVTTHNNGDGSEKWLNNHADLHAIFVAGDSAGANISHNVVLRAGINGVKIAGMILFHPFFGNEEPDKLLEIIFPASSGSDDPRVNPGSDPDLGRLGCGKVLVFVAEKDSLRDRGWNYYVAVKKSGFEGIVEIDESKGEGHVFHLLDPKSDKAMEVMKKTVCFLNYSL